MNSGGPLEGLYQQFIVHARDYPLHVGLLTAAGLAWQVWMIAEVIAARRFATSRVGQRLSDKVDSLIAEWSLVGFCKWMFLSLFFSRAIWGDLWSFLRVLSEANILGGLFLLSSNRAPSRAFVYYSSLLAIVLAGMVVFRP